MVIKKSVCHSFVMRRVALWCLGAVVLFAVVAVGCDSGFDRERYVIKDTAPFYTTELPNNPERADAVVEAVRQFADRHQMDFLVAQRTLGPGEFNASANGPSLNVRAMHTNFFGGTIRIYATSRGAPTGEHQALVQEFVADVRNASMPLPEAER
jgi:hypothetical protein